MSDGVVDHEAKKANNISNTGGDRYGITDPAYWGWRRPAIAELQAEQLSRLEQELAKVIAR